MTLTRVRRTYLELSDPSEFRSPTKPPPPGARAERIAPCTVAMYRALYRAVGESWYWRDQNARPDEQLDAHLRDPRVSVWGLRAPGVDGPSDTEGRVGYFELVQRDDRSVEILYFGLIPSAIGRGLGGFLLARAVEEAWRLGATRVELNTCTLDAPQALPNYLARGFRPMREEWYETQL